MSRLTKIEGEFHGVKFEVKPTPLNIDEIEEESRDMMIEWYEENEPDIVEDVKNGLDLDSIDNDEAMEKINKMNAWKRDVDFRSTFLSFKAQNAMDFKGKLPDGIWKRDDIELSTIQEAWDFFCGNRRIPQDGLQAR